MRLYWAADTDGGRYCVRAPNMITAIIAYRAVVGEDPEGIDLAAGDDVQVIEAGAGHEIEADVELRSAGEAIGDCAAALRAASER